ncbi:gamma-glutamyltranspeptidase / glutathione hydrolase [Georgenia satyanarayanai]|uniref:Gamma-glutamyltranspeptidase / glutathione hydrolase n=1 Tax=Georgenia satyanarayanai TaxID=860221 RepID=A0A2Y9BX06_9MICO|nr:gamma-glutamyltransferase [Georgenia satyanarayanai]PYG00603.1 gamma-glutamyltranspeptidase/glutathione hydrolase [Georgenia satyanarayanai]SSA39992.1 gamma-glutamyltranspeptidase / glutathione hydrolase [Georgenia satyanarayanai]
MSHLARRPHRPATLILPLTAVLVVGGVPAAHGLPQEYDKEATATGYDGAVASLDPYASLAGLEVLREGGNAVDAAVAASAALGVTRPYDGSIGGGGFFVHYSAETGEVTTIDSREEAWAAMEPDVFLEDGEPIPFAERRVSGLSQGVPGLVRGWELALSEYGTKSLAEVLEPAVRVAEDGFVVDDEYERRTEDNLEIFRDFSSSSATFLVDDEAPEAGTVITNEELADTYRLLGEEGADVFYEGEIAEAIVATNTTPPLSDGAEREVRPGEMTLADLAGYEALEQEPTVVDYRGLQVYGMAPPSSGGSTVGEALNILEGFDLSAMAEEEVLHHMAESSALAFADRNTYVGDEAFLDVPLTGLLSQEFADERRELIGERAQARPVPAGDPWPYDDGDGDAADAGSAEGHGSTTHLTVADRWGNVVSYTFTIEQIGGSGIAVPGYGFLLNNQLTDFEPDPEHPANAPEGGKRPRSSMAPTIVLDDGAPVAAFGSPGGATIITTVLQIAVNHLDLGMSLPEAIAAPRLSSRNGAASEAEAAIAGTALGEALRARGHTVNEVGTLGNATGIAFLPDGRLQAAAEPERSGGGSAMVVRPEDVPPPSASPQFHLSNDWRGTTDEVFRYGRSGDEVLIGDWDGDGTDTIAVRRGNVVHVSGGHRGGDASLAFTYGRPGDTLLVGDWDGDGHDTLAVRRGADYHVKNRLTGGEADRVVRYGRENDTVLVGDWDADGTDTFTVRRDATYHVRNSLRGGDADTVFTYGRSGDVTLAGDWDGNGTDTLSIQRGRVFHVNNSLRGGDADRVLTFGREGDEVYVGDWDGNGTDTLGVRRH